MDLIVNELVGILKSELPLIKKEYRLVALLVNLSCELITMALSSLDDELASTMTTGQVQQKKWRTLVTPFGEIRYQRRYYFDPSTAQRFFALDHFLGIAKTQRVSPLLRSLVAKASTGMTTRHEAAVFSLLTPVTLSHQAVSRIVHEVGQELAEKQEAKTVQDEESLRDNTAKPAQQSKYIVVTGDALVYKQSSPGAKRGFLYRYTVHEGSRQIRKANGKPAKNRRELKNAVNFSSTDRVEALWQADTYLHTHYDLKNTVVITNSDNGVGFTPDQFAYLGSGAKMWIHQLDHFHVRRKIAERLGDNFPELNARLLQAIFYSYDFKAVQAVLDTLASILSTDPSRNYQYQSEINKLAAYLKRNWDSLRPLRHYHVRNPGGLGTSESGHRKYSYRLKGQGKYWSAAGAKAQAVIIDCVKNKQLERYLEVPPMDLKRQERPYDGKFIRQLLKQPQKPVEPHVGVVQGQVQFYGQRYKTTYTA